MTALPRGGGPTAMLGQNSAQHRRAQKRRMQKQRPTGDRLRNSGRGGENAVDLVQPFCSCNARGRVRWRRQASLFSLGGNVEGMGVIRKAVEERCGHAATVASADATSSGHCR